MCHISWIWPPFFHLILNLNLSSYFFQKHDTEWTKFPSWGNVPYTFWLRIHCCPKGQIWQIGRLPNPKLTQKSKFNFFFKCYHNICHQTVIKLDWSNTKSKNNVFVFFCSNLWFDFTPLEHKSTFLVAL